jgi:tetratricopeptide (TPR) repeat protein
MSHLLSSDSSLNERTFLTPSSQAAFTLPAEVGYKTQSILQRMFRDPRVLDAHERTDLIAQLRAATALAPHVPELRVLLGMALSVDLQAQEALEELREAVIQAPDCFIARLKFGELLMRLRVCDQAAEHTQRAAELASNVVQSDLARKQAATIRTMLREGIERGGYRSMFSRLPGMLRRSSAKSTAPVLIAAE